MPERTVHRTVSHTVQKEDDVAVPEPVHHVRTGEPVPEPPHLPVPEPVPPLKELESHVNEIRNLSLTLPSSELLGELLDVVARAYALIVAMQREHDASSEG